MKKTFTTITLALVTLLSTSAFMKISSTGIAGYTGAPGETSCNTSGCHSGGSSAAAGATITSVPSFTNGEFIPGDTYVITVNLEAAGFNRYGFGCEILNASNANSGIMQTAGPGVKFLNSGSRKNAVHTTPKSGTGGASFTFEWVAPTTDDAATIYVAGNAVNFNGNSTGDFPIPPINLPLFAKVDPTVGVRENNKNVINGMSVFPNPATGLTSVSYELSRSGIVSVELVDISGKLIKEFYNEAQTAGSHSRLLALHNIAPGVYFVKTSVDSKKVSQKLIAVQ